MHGVETIAALMEQIKRGELILPEFQRGYVWKLDQVKSYVLSLYRNYPTGHFLIWKTYKPQAARGKLQASDNTFSRLILDGQQRLTTVYAMFEGRPPAFYEGEDLYFDLYFNLLEEDFQFFQKSKMANNAYWLAVTPFLKKGIHQFLDEIDSLPSETKTLYSGQLKKFNKLDGIRNYSYHLDEVSDKPVEEIVRIFNLVNSNGTPLNKADLALARVCSYWPEARETLRRARDGFEKITGETVSKYANWRRSTSPQNSVLTVNGELRTLRRMLNLAQEWGLISQSPNIHELPGGKGRDRVISFEEEARYLAGASRTVRDAAIMASDSGLRPNSELFPLEWSNVQLESTPDAPQGFIHITQGKTDAATRNLPLTPRTREMLLARRQMVKESKYVFPGPGKSGHLTTIQHAHEKAIREAGLQPFEFYCWRHTFGTRCAESGMDRFTLARLMGHSSPRVAERYYIHVTEPHVMTGFERFLNYHAGKLVDAVPKQTDRVQ